jgi:hypothetical protein
MRVVRVALGQRQIRGTPHDQRDALLAHAAATVAVEIALQERELPQMRAVKLQLGG